MPPHYMRDALTMREIEILRLAAPGDASKIIARKAHVTEQTVKFHLSNAYRKLGVDTRSAAIWRCIELGLIVPPNVSEPTACPMCGREYADA